MILITGATGNVGVELVKKLAGGRQRVRAFVHRRASARSIALPGIEIIEGDFAQPATFTRALVGIERLFLLIPSSSQVEQQQRNFVDAAKRSNVRHIVKLSQFAADESAPGRFQRYHGAVENYIRESCIPFTFLRPNLFMQGLLNFRSVISSRGSLYAPAGNAKVSVVDVRDIASLAARALTESGHEGKIYDITGPQALTHAEMADQLSWALAKPIKYVDVPPAAMKKRCLDLACRPGKPMASWKITIITVAERRKPSLQRFTTSPPAGRSPFSASPRTTQRDFWGKRQAPRNPGRDVVAFVESLRRYLRSAHHWRTRGIFSSTVRAAV